MKSDKLIYPMMQINQIQKDLVEIKCILLKLKYGIKISEKAKLGYLNGKSWEKKHRRRSLGSYYFKHNQKQFECEIPRIWIELCKTAQPRQKVILY